MTDIYLHFLKWLFKQENCLHTTRTDRLLCARADLSDALSVCLSVCSPPACFLLPTTEVLMGCTNTNQSVAIDLWSAGVILLQVHCTERRLRDSTVCFHIIRN